MSSKIPFFTLSNGVRMPSVGLGTWQMTGEEGKTVIRNAILAGYRHIDTATLYQNEEQIGEALAELIAEGVVKREDLFITTKAFCHEIAPDVIEQALRDSLERLRLDYVDLYLAHIPAATKECGNFREDVKVEHIWKGLEKLYELKLTKSIGVSNFNEDQIERVVRIQRIPIHVSQLELHLYLPQKAHREVCKRYRIIVTAYATLGSPGRMSVIGANGVPLFESTKNAANELVDKNVKALAQKYNKTPAQILLRATVEMGIVVIPKTTNPERMKENIDLFDFNITKAEVNLLEAHGKPNQRLFWWPNVAEHPEDPFASER
uniref:Aldo_ket_red domain-containing protein n=1 Tax=Caenorhabditis tropicalis TaxID=1561998 RepID=A0A1I7SZ24_9PELO